MLPCDLFNEQMSRIEELFALPSACATSDYRLLALVGLVALLRFGVRVCGPSPVWLFTRWGAAGFSGSLFSSLLSFQ